MRLAIIAAAGAEASADPLLGERDASIVRMRLELDDLGFECHLVDPEQDLAEQLDNLLDELEDEIDELLFYASCLITVTDDEMCYLCLNPQEPDVGDALTDVAAALHERTTSGTLILLEGRYDDPEADLELLREVGTAVRQAVVEESPGIEVVASLRVMGAHSERIPSRLTAALLESIDGSDGPLAARAAYARVVQSGELGDWPSALVYVPGSPAFNFRADAISEEAAEPAAPSPASQSPAPESPAPEASEAAAPEQELPQDETAEPVEQASDAPDHAAEASDEAPAPAALPTSADEPPIPNEPAASHEGSPTRSTRPDGVRVVPPAERDASPPSEKREATSVSMTLGRGRQQAAPLPKVVIGGGPATAAIRRRLTPAAMPQFVPESSRPPARQRPAEPAIQRARPRQDSAGLITTLAEAPTAKRAQSEPPAEAEVATPDQHAPAADNASHEASRAASSADPAEHALDVDVDVPEAVAPDSAVPESAAPQTVGSPDVVASATESASKVEVAAEAPDVEVAAEALDVEVAAEALEVEQKRPEDISDWTIGDHIDFGDESLEAKDYDEALKRYKRGLSRLGTKVTPERGAIYIRVAEVMRAQGKVRVAISNYDKALGIDPTSRRAILGLVELNAEQSKWRAVLAAEERLLALAPDETTFEFLLQSAERWHQQADHARRARERLRSAHELRPDDERTVRALLAVAEKEKAYDEVIELRSKLAAMAGEPRDIARSFYELGEYCLFELTRERAAVVALEKALDADPTMLEALEVLASALAEEQEWAELERIYSKMIARFKARQDATADLVIAELHHRLALLYRDHFDDLESTLTQLDYELKLRPDHLAPRLLAAEVATEQQDDALALRHLEAALKLEPRRSETFHSIFGLARRADDMDRAFLAAAAVTALGVADDRERIMYRELKPAGVAAHRRTLRPLAWELLRDRRRSRGVEAVMRAIAPAVLRTRVSQLDAEGKLPVLDEALRQDPTSSTLLAVQSLAWGAKFLNVQLPAIYLNKDTEGVFLAPFAKHQATVIARTALSGRSRAELAFLVGRHLALRVPEHELVAHIQSIDELSVCFLAAMKMVLGKVPASGPLAAAADTLAQVLEQQQPEDERAALEAAVNEFTNAGGRVDLNQWVTSVELCARRAGLLLCGDLDVALGLIRGAGATPTLGVEQSIDDLCAFMASTPHALLRQETGCAHGDENEQRPELH